MIEQGQLCQSGSTIEQGELFQSGSAIQKGEYGILGTIAMLNNQISMVLDDIKVAFELLRELEIEYGKFHMEIFEFLHFILFPFRSEDGNI